MPRTLTALLAIGWLSTVPVVAAAGDRVTAFSPCDLRRFPAPADAPEEERPAGCAAAACVEVAPGRRLCKCAREDGEAAFVLADAAGVQRLFGARAVAGSTQDFVVLRGDVDGERGDEWVIANLDSATSGLVLVGWKVVVTRELRAAAPRVSWEVNDFGAASFARPAQGRRGCDVLVTRWGEWLVDATGRFREPHGLYLTGQWFRLRGLRLVPLAARPTLYRRLTFGFAREWRARDRGALAFFLRPGKARALPDPAVRIDAERCRADGPPAPGTVRVGAVPQIEVTAGP